MTREQKTPREVLEKIYCDGQVSGANSISKTNYENIDQVLSDLSEIVMGLKKDEDKGNGSGCNCGAYGECECGCENSDWNDYALYNQAITDIAKLFTDKGER